LRLLLDTHIWIWSILKPDRLSRHVRQELSDARNELWLSPVSTWEALLLHSKSRMWLSNDPATWVTQALSSIREAPLTHEIAVAAYQLPFDNRDPADRFLAATAGVLGLTLVTADRRLLGLGTIATLANR
jgi:PIN domain nuclease of toxin-antitoxin system